MSGRFFIFSATKPSERARSNLRKSRKSHVSQTSFRGEIVGRVAKCWLFSQAGKPIVPQIFLTHAPVAF